MKKEGTKTIVVYMLDKWDKAKMMIISYIILKDSIVKRINTLVALLENAIMHM